MGTESVVDFIIIKSKKYGDKKCYFNVEFRDLIVQYKWHLLPNKERTLFYAAANNKNLLMHRLITGAPVHLDVDHINHDGLDNRMVNLKVCSHKENMQNQCIRKNNTSGHLNVYYDNNAKRRKRWFAKIGNTKSSRYFTIEEAIEARDKMLIERKEGYRY